MKLAISTQWKLDLPATLLVESLQQLDPDALVLGSNLSENTRQRLLRWKRPIHAVSLYTIRPSGISPWNDLSETLPLCTEDREIRHRALVYAEDALVFCVQSSCPLMTVPLRVASNYPERHLLDLYCLALEPLLEMAYRRSVRIALPRQERLGVDVIVRLRQIFSGAPLGYWHREEGVGVLPEPTPVDPFQQTAGGLFLLGVEPPPPPPLPPLVLPEALTSCTEGISFSGIGAPRESWTVGERVWSWVVESQRSLQGQVVVYEAREEEELGVLREMLAWFRGRAT